MALDVVPEYTDQATGLHVTILYGNISRTREVDQTANRVFDKAQALPTLLRRDP